MYKIDLHKLPFINRNAIPWIIWSIAALYYFFEIILRMLPGTMATQLMDIFQINATDLGVFTAFYYWSYTAMQIPAGLIVDRFSIRRILFTACLLCVGGFALVHASNNIHLAEAGRFVIGFGSAFAYVSALKVASIWLPRHHFGLATCIVDSIGMLGAMFTEVVMVRLSINSGYQKSIFVLLITGIVIALIIFFIFKDAPNIKATHIKLKNKNMRAVSMRDKSNVIDKIALIAKHPQVWLIGLVGCLFYLPSSVVGDVWGIPYLKAVYHLDKTTSSNLLATFFAGWIIMGPFLGAISDKIEKRCVPINITIGVAAILFTILIFTPPVLHQLIPLSMLYIIFFLIGVAMGTHPLVFALAKENFSNKFAGTTVAFTNMLIMLGGLLFQPLVGFLLDYDHHTLFKTGIEHYTAANYTFALSIIPLSLILCLIIMYFVKETGTNLHQQERNY